MDKSAHWQRPRATAAGGGVLGVALLAVLLAGCSFERAFCGSSSLACTADVSYAGPD